jgi:ABC-type lipoprotein export system ATPase subunit
MRMLAGRGRAVVIVTHDPRVLQLGDRVVRIEDGMIKKEVPETEVPAGLFSRVSTTSSLLQE